jgi:hypothetical protein
MMDMISDLAIIMSFLSILFKNREKRALQFPCCSDGIA